MEAIYDLINPISDIIVKEVAMAAIAAGPPKSSSPKSSPTVAEFAREPDAAHWARVCAWVPGTGHCRNHDCANACIFREQREAEARAVQRWRRLRRIFTRPRLR
jgi:hypothetical protein